MKNIVKILGSYSCIVFFHICVEILMVINLPPRLIWKNYISVALFIILFAACVIIGRYWEKHMDIKRRESIVMISLVIISFIQSIMLFEKESLYSFLTGVSAVYFHTFYILALFIASHRTVIINFVKRKNPA